METRNKILLVCTSAKSLKQTTSSRRLEDIADVEEHRRTGADVKELAYVHYYLSKRAGSQLVLASTQDQYPIPLDPRSMEASKDDQIVQDFLQDKEAMECLKSPCKMEDVIDKLGEFSAVVFPGGPGCMIDLANESFSEELSKIVTCIYSENEGLVAAIGFGLAALLNVENRPSSTKEECHKTMSMVHNAWLKNRAVTCNTTEETKDMQLDKALPFSLEQRLKDLGVKFHKTDKFRPYVVVDERLITGQNCNSTKEWVEAIIKECHKIHKQ
jgi:putative intracellular protease/amidase